VGGYLLFGKDRFDRFPDARVQAGRLAGKDRSRLLDSAEIRTRLPRAAEQAIEFVQMHMSRATLVTKTRLVYSGVSDNWYWPGSCASPAAGFFSYRSARIRQE